MQSNSEDVDVSFEHKNIWQYHRFDWKNLSIFLKIEWNWMKIPNKIKTKAHLPDPNDEEENSLLANMEHYKKIYNKALGSFA